jgi:hypothetical protein
MSIKASPIPTMTDPWVFALLLPRSLVHRIEFPIENETNVFNMKTSTPLASLATSPHQCSTCLKSYTRRVSNAIAIPSSSPSPIRANFLQNA